MSALLECLRMAFQGLINNKVRSILTMLGIIMGVGAVIAMVGLGQGFSAHMSAEFQSMGTNLLSIMKDRRVTGAWDLTVADAKALEGLPGVQAVAPTYSGSATVLNNQGVESSDTTVNGVTVGYQTARNYKMSIGRFITEEDDDRKKKVAVLGSTTAETLFPNEAYPIGQVVRLNGIPFEVIGVMEEKGGSGFQDPDDVVLIPLGTAQSRLFGASTFRGQYTLSGIDVQATSDKEMSLAEEQIAATLREQHNLATGAEDDFRIMNQAEMIETTTSMLDTLTLFLGAVAAISLVVGGIGIMNIMLVSVTERTREIGLRKAIGAGRGDILLQFLIEAMGLSFTGGLLGIAFGVIVAGFISPQLGVDPVIAPYIMVIAAGFSAMIGIVFGIYPAMRASGLQPVVALRYE